MTQPGWYPDPQDATLARWWDGVAWTTTVQPLAPVAETAPAPAAAPVPPPAPGADVLHPAADVLHSGAERRTVVEQLLGGSWLPALRVAVPVLAVTAGLAALTAAAQLWVKHFSFVQPLLQTSANTTGAYFHNVAQQMAMALGSPLFVQGSDGGALGNSPLLVSVAAVLAFALLLRGQTDGLPLLQRVALGARALVVTVALLLVPTFFAGQHVSGGEDTVLSLSVSPGRVLGWSLLLFGVTAVIVAVRPLEQLAARVPAFSYPAARVTLAGAYAVVTTAVLLGFVATLVAGFVQTPGSSTGVLRLLPAALGHGVDLGVDGWQVGSLGGVRNTLDGHLTLSLFDRHGASPFFLFMLAIPVLSTLCGVLVIGRRTDVLDGRTLSRCSYRMALPVGVLYVLLAVPSTIHIDKAHLGPQVLLGLLLVTAWTFLLGFALGQLLLRNRQPGPVATPAASVRPTALPAAVPVLLGASLGLLVAGGVAAAITHGGQHAPYVPTLAASSGDTLSDTSSTDVAAQDRAARRTLRELAIAEETYFTDNNSYTDDEGALGYTEPSDVSVSIVRADASSYCATASGVDSAVYFTVRDSQFEDGNTC